MIWAPRVQPSKEEWHRWFAWFPVRLEDGRYVWLNFVQRRIVYSDYYQWWEYSLPSSFT